MKKFIALFLLIPFVANAACEDITDEEQKSLCMASVRSDGTYCDKIRDNDAKYYCWAKIKQDKSFCAKMKSDTAKEECLSNFGE